MSYRYFNTRYKYNINRRTVNNALCNFHKVFTWTTPMARYLLKTHSQSRFNTENICIINIWQLYLFFFNLGILNFGHSSIIVVVFVIKSVSHNGTWTSNRGLCFRCVFFWADIHLYKCCHVMVLWSLNMSVKSKVKKLLLMVDVCINWTFYSGFSTVQLVQSHIVYTSLTSVFFQVKP